MLRYGMYRHYFPLMALARAVRVRQQVSDCRRCRGHAHHDGRIQRRIRARIRRSDRRVPGRTPRRSPPPRTTRLALVLFRPVLALAATRSGKTSTSHNSLRAQNAWHSEPTERRLVDDAEQAGLLHRLDRRRRRSAAPGHRPALGNDPAPGLARGDQHDFQPPRPPARAAPRIAAARRRAVDLLTAFFAFFSLPGLAIMAKTPPRNNRPAPPSTPPPARSTPRRRQCSAPRSSARRKCAAPRRCRRWRR